MKIEDVMTRRVAVCDREASLSDAARLLWENDCGCVPVVDSAGGVVGMITDRDICMAAYTCGRPLHELSVGGSMGTPPRTCLATDTIEDVLATLAEVRIRRMPVVDERGRALGVVSLNDLVRTCRETGTVKSRRALADALIETLECVGAPRHATDPEPTVELKPERTRTARARAATPKRKRSSRRAKG